MNLNTVGALIKKDLIQLFRNRLLSILPLATIMIIIVLYFLMPRSVEEEMTLAVFGATIPQTLLDELSDEGVELIYTDSEEAVHQGVDSGDFIMGIVFPRDLLPRLSAGGRPQVKAIFSPSILPEMKEAEIKLIERLVFLLQGEPLNIQVEEELVLGPDMTGRQIPMRDRLLPMFAALIIIMEIMGLGTLIVEEYDRGTLSALRVSAVTMESLLTAKAVTGIALAFLQAVLLLAVTGTLATRPLLLITGLLLGSLLVVGFGFLVAALSRDMMTVISWSMLVMIILLLPAFTVIMPGLISGWVRILPSYYLTDLMHRAVHFDAGWAQQWRNLLFLFIFDLGLLIFGSLALRRKAV